jgi:hypothetical protein
LSALLIGSISQSERRLSIELDKCMKFRVTRLNRCKTLLDNLARADITPFERR